MSINEGSMQSPLMPSFHEESRRSYDTEAGTVSVPMVQIKEDEHWYPGEKHVFRDKIPLSRTLFLLGWYYEIVWGGIAFIVDYTCNSWMKAACSLSIIFGTLYIHYAVLETSPRPLTYTWAKQEGLKTLGIWLYLIYLGTSVLLCIFFASTAALFQIVSWDDLWDWNC